MKFFETICLYSAVFSIAVKGIGINWIRGTHTLVHTVSQIVLIGGQNYLLDIQNM